ncbi:MAG: hypothetical protein KDC05_01850 [Bacteroidales bacterium]|nr:hypothetical protein [Bacteroidales bacterium]
MKLQKLIILFFFILIGFAGISQNIMEPKDLIPANDEIVNWQLIDSVNTYTDEDLYMYINGGADLYLEYGFNKLGSCKYRNRLASKIILEVYQMKNDAGAFGVFTINSSGKGKKIEIGNEAVQYDYYLHFWKQNYYVRCASTVKSEGVIDTLQQLAKQVASKIELPGKKPELFVLFNKTGYPFKQVKYFKGQVALANIFNFSHGSVAGFNEGISGKLDDKMVFVFSYENEKQRREWFASLKGKMNMSMLFDQYTTVEDGFTVKDRMGIMLSFKPVGKYILAIKGMDWPEAQPVFEKTSTNLP